MADDAPLRRLARQADELAASVPQTRFAHIRISHRAVPGSLLDVPVVDERGAETGERQLLVHPDDWTEIESYARSFEDAAQSPVLALMGVPVRKDSDVL